MSEEVVHLFVWAGVDDLVMYQLEAKYAYVAPGVAIKHASAMSAHSGVVDGGCEFGCERLVGGVSAN